MERESESNSDALRGALIALALVSMLLGVFVLFAYGRSNDEVQAFKRHLARLAEIFERPEQDQDRKSSVRESVKVAPDLGLPPSPGRHFGSPGAGSGSAGSGHASIPEGGGTGNGDPGLVNRRFTGAADALKGAIASYKLDPKKTGTISISTQGRIVKEEKGQLTTYGLPTQSVTEGIIVTGATRSD